jgi:hypothetical protein
MALHASFMYSTLLAGLGICSFIGKIADYSYLKNTTEQGVVNVREPIGDELQPGGGGGEAV